MYQVSERTEDMFWSTIYFGFCLALTVVIVLNFNGFFITMPSAIEKVIYLSNDVIQMEVTYEIEK